MTIEQALKIMGILSNAQELITLGDKSGANEALNNAKERLLLEIYFAEFETIDGEIQHPNGYTFEQWLKANNTFLSKPSARAYFVTLTEKEIPTIAAALGDRKTNLDKYLEHLEKKHTPLDIQDPDSYQTKQLLDEIQECEHEIAEIERLKKRLAPPSRLSPL